MKKCKKLCSLLLAVVLVLSALCIAPLTVNAGEVSGTHYSIIYNANDGSGNYDNSSNGYSKPSAVSSCMFEAPEGKKFKCWTNKEGTSFCYPGDAIPDDFCTSYEHYSMNVYFVAYEFYAVWEYDGPLTTIDSVACTVTAPVAGEKPDYSAVPADSSAYTAEVASWHTGGARTDRTLTSDETFAQGTVYRAYVRFTANEGYIFADDAAYTVNGMAATKTTIRNVDYYVVSFTAGAAPVSYIIGDADTDGEVTILDATAIQRKLANLSTEAYDANAADADEDSEVTILDATAIQRHLASLDTNPNIGKPKA